MITVYKYGYGGAEPSPDMSPFVVKLETWLRLSGIAYDTRIGTPADMPKDKLPSLRLEDGRLLADSSFIIEQLQASHPQALRDDSWSPLQRAQAVAIRALFESELYWVGYYLRWCVKEKFDAYYPPLIRAYAQQSSPPWLRPFVPVVLPLLLPTIRKQRAKQAWQQGMGRHSLAEVEQIGVTIWKAVVELLGDKPYLMGEAPSSLDASGFAWVHGYVTQPVPSAVRDYVLSQPRLLAYHERIWQRCWAADYAPKRTA